MWIKMWYMCVCVCLHTHTHIYHIKWSFPGGAVVKNIPANLGETQESQDLIPGLGRSPGVGNGNPLQYSHPGNPIDRGAWWATVFGVTKESDTIW